jgi:hypothetical protein
MSEQKLGSVTYLDHEKTEQSVTMAGVTFKPGEAVDVNKVLTDQGQAEKLKQKLANNPFFKVEGGPDHAKAAAEREKAEREAEKHRASVVSKQVADLKRSDPQPPPNWKGPAEPHLEQAPAKRK